MQSTGAVGIKSLHLSDKGIPKHPFYEKLEGASQEYIAGGTNTNTAIWLTYGGASPALSLVGEWISRSSHLLAYFELGKEGTSWVDTDSAPTLVYTSDTVFEEGYNQTIFITDKIREGDVMLLACFASDVLTIDSSWTQVESKDISDVFNTQHMYLFKKEVTPTDIGGKVKITQIPLGNIGSNLTVWRNVAGVQIGTAVSSKGTSSTGVIDSPVNTPIVDNSVFFSVASSMYTAAPLPSTFTAGEGWTQVTPKLTEDEDNPIRLGVAYKYANKQDPASCYWVQNSELSSLTGCGNIIVTIEKAP